MKYLVAFHPDTFKETKEYVTTLEISRPGYGVLFLEQIDAVIRILQEFPFVYPRIFPKNRIYRAALGKPFNKSYSVYYEVAENVIYILAIMSNRQDPEVWKQRK